MQESEESQENPQEKSKTAFKDFKKSITKQEFETIYRICEEKYIKLDKLIAQRTKFVQKIEEKIEDSASRVEGIQEDKKKLILLGIEKLVYSLKKKGDLDMFKNLEKDIEEIEHLVEFLNRFKLPEDYHADLDFSFLSIRK